jgi:hypothetical protein
MVNATTSAEPAPAPAETSAIEDPSHDRDVADETTHRAAGTRPWITRPRAVTLAGLGLVGFVLLSWSGLGEHIWGGEVPPKPAIVHESTDVTETPEEREARWRRDVVGRWHIYFKGDRYMTVRDDGTASIEANLVDYNWFDKQVVGADKVTFEIVWTIEQGNLTFDTVGGEPAYSVNVITTMHGSKKSYPIVHVTDEEFRYQSDGDDPDYVWTRIAAE